MSEDVRTAHIVGREEELARLRAVLARAAAGESAAMIITGEPGVGKTALARAAFVGPDAPGRHLVVRCLPMQALSTGLAPLRLALRTSSAPVAVTASCLAGIDRGQAIRAIDDWVEAVVADGPLVIVVDDLQWADPDLQDLVLYLVAGPRDRRLAVVVTVRTTGLPDGHSVHGWLADMIRFPHVGRLDAAPLSRPATEAQLIDLLGGQPHQSLTEDVFRISRGNPFLTSLLARTVEVTDRQGPAEFPSDLTTAVTGTWHRCSPSTRTVTCLLALAGGPEQPDRLQRVVDDLTLGADVPAALAEAASAGLLEPSPTGWWFHHPLQAEVLDRAVAAVDRPRWQAAYARLGDDLAASGSGPDMAMAVAQSVRHDQAGSASDAYRWAVRAGEIGRGGRGTAELRRVLRRAIALRPQVPDAAETPDMLWQAVRELAVDDGAFGEELDAIEALLSITDPAEHPLRVSELLVRRMLAKAMAGLEFLSVPDMRRAVDLASADRSSWQYALALAELGHAGYWHDDPEATAGADEALAVARAAGHPAALSFALTTSAMLAVDRLQPAVALPLASEAAEMAVAAGDGWALVHATMWEVNASPEPYGEEAVDLYRRRREQLAASGGSEVHLVQLAAVEAESRLDLGDWSVCERLLREALVGDPGPMADLRARITAARFAAYQGRVADAVGHVERADDLIGGHRDFRNVDLDAARALVLVVAGRPAEAYRTAWTAATETGVAVSMAEYLIPLAARAVADQAQRAHDHRQSDRRLIETLDRLRTRFPAVLDPEDSASPLWRSRIVALQAWYDGETTRARRDPEEPERWNVMRATAAEGRLPWLELYACWRGAEAVLRRGRTGRGEGVRLLRAGHDLALRLAAAGTRVELEELARQAHVDLRSGAAPPLVDAPQFGTLTPRERELLGYLTRGLTYAEIAEALVISQKTVSSHVSNLLRKTGTASRVELTRLVGRIGS